MRCSKRKNEKNLSTILPNRIKVVPLRTDYIQKAFCHVVVAEAFGRVEAASVTYVINY